MNRILFLSLFLLGCPSETPTDSADTDTDTDSDTDADSDTDTDSDTDSDVTYLEPIAVGFELYAGVLPDGQLTSYFTTNGDEIPPGVWLTFADEAFFSAGSTEAQEGHYCIAWGHFPAAPSAEPLDLYNGATPWVSYELALELYPETWGCGDVLDPDVYGEAGEDLYMAFDGMRLGIAFADMTEYLAGSWSDYESWEDFMFAMYIAINDPDLTFDGDDWTTGILYEWDTETHVFLTDPDSGNLLPLDISAANDVDSLPEGYLQSFAYWYQDFPLMDFDVLKDNAPE